MTENNQLTTTIKEAGLIQKNKIDELMSSFTGYFAEAKKLATESRGVIVKDETQTDLMQEARGKRLALKELRVEVEKTRKELKEESKREGKAIDGVANIIKALIIPVEEHLEKQEKYAETKERERAEKLHNERIEKLSPYVEDISFYSVGSMEDEAFNRLLEDSKNTFNARKEAERKVEEERLVKEKAEKEEQERIRVENEKLRKEAEEQGRKLAKEREAQEKKLEEERKKREVIEAKIIRERIDREREERIERDKKEAEKQAAEEAKRKALLAPDKDKLNILATEIDNFKFPAMESKEAGDILSKAIKQLSITSEFLREEAKKL